MDAFQGIQTRTVLTRALLCIALALVATRTPAQQPPIPQGASPGGVLPRIEALPAQPDAQRQLFSVPKVSERPLGLEEGPRVKVTAFKLAGVIDRRSAGIKVADVQALMNQVLQTQPAEGLTVNQLQEAAGKIADYYHQHGFVLAQAFIPAQQVENGVVLVQVLEAKLASVTFEGNKHYSTAVLERPFKDLLGAPVERSSIESALLTLTDYPGLSAFGVLKAGQDVGTTDLAVRVQKEDRADWSVQLDNEGAQFAGQYRAQLGLTLNNPLGDADRFRGYVLYGVDPSSSKADGLYGGFDYELPIFTARDALELSALRDSYELGGNRLGDLAALEPRGDTYIASLGYRHYLEPTRTMTSSFGLTFGVLNAIFRDLGTTGYVDQFKDDLTTAALDYQLSFIDTRFRGVNALHVTYTHGFKNLLGSLGDYEASAALPASREGATGDFDKVVLDAQRLQRLTKTLSFLVHVTGQYSNDPLVSLEQLPVTGPDAVRAYSVSQLLADKGVVATGEFILAAPGIYDRPAFGGRTWGQVLTFSLYVDYADSKLNGVVSQGEQATTSISGYGGSIQFNVPNHVFARVDVSAPITTSIKSSDGHDPEVYFRLVFNF